MQQHEIGIDHERTAALDVVLMLADAGAGWHEYDHALDLLNHAEIAGGSLPPEYELKRRIWAGL
jgi:hypothetical protein